MTFVQQHVATRNSLMRFVLVAMVASAIADIGSKNVCAQRIRLDASGAGTTNNESVSDTDPARLNVNSENQQLLRRADELVREGRFDLACTIWQRVLDDGAASLITRDEWQFKTRDGATYRRYRPVAVELQETISKLPAAGLTIYRASADAEARALLAAGDGSRRDAALSEVVRRYFLSSLGDDAALELASRALDRHDFVGAARQLNQLDKLYPDPSVPRGEILIRLAVAAANAGDAQGAEDALRRIDQLGARRPPQRLLDAVAAEVKHPRPAALDAPGIVQKLPASYLATGLSDGWYDVLSNPVVATTNVPNPSAQRRSSYARPMAPGTDRESILQRWQQSSRPPAGQLLIQDRLAFYKTANRLACRDLVTGKLNWLGWENAYQPVLPANNPYYGNMVPMHRPGLRTGILPGSSPEIQLLGDRVHASMTLVGDMLLAIEAQPPKEVGPPKPNIQQFYPGGPTWSRQRENQLTAYEATTGKLRWVRGAAEKIAPGQPAAKAGFLAAPVPFGRQLLVPLIENNAVWLASLDSATGNTTWRTKICDEPDNNLAVWSPVGLTVEGGDVYVATGAGVVAALDAISGSMHWLTLYDRRQRAGNPGGAVGAGPGMAARFNRNMVPAEPAACWQDDVVVASGSRLVVLPSDADEILGLDRGSGQFIWKSARLATNNVSSDPTKNPPAPDYCLGVLGENVYVAGAKTVRCYKISGGRLEWEHALSNSCGRGVLTEEAIYLPDGNDILQLDPRTGPQVTQRELSRTRVVIPSGEPLGNLFTDGRQLLVVGLFRVYSLEGLETRLARLSKRIADGDRQARRDRMRIYYRAGKLDDAVEDLVASYQDLSPQSQADEFPSLLEGMEELQLAASRPVRAVELLAGARADLRTAKVATLPGDQLRRQSALMGTALASIKKEPPRDLSVYLKGAEIAEEEYLAKQLCGLVHAVAKPSEAAMLQQALGNPSAVVRRVAAAGLGKIPGDATRDALIGALQEKDSLARLEAAWHLANRGERACLPVLAEMLKSDEALVRERAFQALQQSTGQTHGYQHYASPADRNTAAEAWVKWIAGPGATAELKFPLPEAPQGMARLLVASLATNRVVELDAQGKEVWSQQVTGPYGVHGTPDGRRVVANFSAQTVHEFDSQGKEIWKVTNLPGNPTCVQRLANGNTLVVLGNNGQVLEIAPDKRILQTQQFGPGIGFARRLDNGNTLVCLPQQNRVAEFDPSRREVATFPAMNATGARRLDNGNTLIAEQRQNRVVEISPSGALVWSANDIPGPWDVERLGNGNTLVSNGRGVDELAPDGRIIRTLNYPSVYRLSAY